MTQVYRRYEKTAEVEYHSDLDGWGEFEVVPSRFYVGVDKFYEGMKIEIPIIAYSNHREIFIEGFSFRRIGHENDVIEILWIVAHIALSLFWIRKFGVDFRSVIFLKGKSNLFKTTVVSFLVNIFAKNRRRANIRLTSTRAYTQNFVTKMSDNLVMLDDFSNTVGADDTKARENAEIAIRAVVDGMFSGKMNISDLSEGRVDAVQSVVVITVEDAHRISLSIAKFILRNYPSRDLFMSLPQWLLRLI